MKNRGNPAAGQEKPDTPAPPDYRGKVALTNVSHVRTELARLYREARSGKLDVGVATKFTFILQALAKVIETSDMERRLAELERRGTRGPQPETED